MKHPSIRYDSGTAERAEILNEADQAAIVTALTSNAQEMRKAETQAREGIAYQEAHDGDTGNGMVADWRPVARAFQEAAERYEALAEKVQAASTVVLGTGSGTA